MEYLKNLLLNYKQEFLMAQKATQLFGGEQDEVEEILFIISKYVNNINFFVEIEQDIPVYLVQEINNFITQLDKGKIINE